MAGGAEIGALRVNIGADTADLEKGLKDSQAALAAFAGAVAGGVSAIATRAIAFAEDIGKSLVKIVADMGKLHDSSQKLGVSVEALSVLAHQADLADISFESLSKASIKLSKAMVSAIKDPTSEAGQAFKQLGISVDFLKQNLGDQPKVMAQIAEAYSKVAVGAGLTENATKLFGKAGADLIPMLREGRDALKETADNAQAFGIVVSTEAAKAADDLGDALKNMGAQTKGVFVQALEVVLPAMAKFAQSMVEARKEGGFLEIATKALADALGILTAAAISTMAVFDGLATAWGAIFKAFSLATKGDFTGAFDAIQAGLFNTAKVASNAATQIKDLFSGATQARAALTAEETKAEEATKKQIASTQAAKSAIDQYNDSLLKKLGHLNAEVQTLGMSAVEQEKARAVMDLYTTSIAKQIPVTQAMIDKVTKYGEAIGVAKLTIQGFALDQANLAPSEQLVKRQEDLQTMLNLNAISARTFAQEMGKAAQKVTDEWTTATAGLAGGFSQMFAQMGKKSKEFATFSKALAIVEATINTYQAFTKALSGGVPPWNYVLAAGVLAAGLAKVMAIQSQSIPSAAVGFQGIVPGGFGGGDSKLFQAMVEPGEQIDITPGTDVRGGRGGNAVVELRGLGDKRYSLDEVKEIMRGIGDAMGFGYKFVSA